MVVVFNKCDDWWIVPVDTQRYSGSSFGVVIVKHEIWYEHLTLEKFRDKQFQNYEISERESLLTIGCD